MNPIDNVLATLRSRGEVKPRGTGWRCLCPAHEDSHPSLDVDEGRDHRVLLICRSRGCSAASIADALGLGLRDLFNGTFDQVRLSFDERTVATYDYRDERGEVLFQTVRLAEPKDFRQRRREGDKWVWNLQGVRRVLYRLPELLAADSSALVFVVEGEKDADSLAKLGLVVTTNPMGAGKWRAEYAEYFRGRVGVIVPDNDEPGREHAEEVRDSLIPVAASVKLLALPGLPPKGDVSDWLAAGGTADELVRLAQASPKVGATAKGDAPPSEPDVPEQSYPEPLLPEAFHGLAGEFVRAVEPASEADPVALLVQFLIGVGNAVGRHVHAVVEGDRHGTNEFAVLVGRSARGRKGTSWGRVREVLTKAEQRWADERVMGGLSSGEGVIWNVRDPVEKQERVKEKGQPVRYEKVEADPGVEDKRLLVIEPEFANVLKQTERQGNTLSAILRQAWETGRLRSMTKNSPAQATGAHISLIGHITEEELRRYLTATESANGFGNRFLWFFVSRSKLLPEGGRPDISALLGIEKQLASVMEFAKSERVVTRDESARALWREAYSELSGDRYGLAGHLTTRAEAHVLRLSLLYALLDRSPVVSVDHLNAAMAVWQFAEDSVRCIFGDRTGHPLADDILALLRKCPNGATRTEIRDMVGARLPADRIGDALGVLLRASLARFEKRGGKGGRPSELWFAVKGVKRG